MPKPCAPSSVGTTAHNTSPYLTLARIRFVPGWLWRGGGMGWPRVALAPIVVKPMRANASALYRATFGVAPRAAASAPGRVNLIGEHTDYNGGPVLPVACAVRTVAAAKALSLLAGARLRPRQLAGVAFRAEHDYVGVRCGMMDQMIAAVARPGQALLLECASLAARHIPIGGRLLLVDSGVRRELAAGALNERRAECEAAVARLKNELPELRWLASWPAAWLPRLKRALPEPLRSRALHVVGETARARFGAQLLARGHLKRFGELLYESHESCRRLYACSTPELDTIVAAARRAGALGARLTGAGWGGAVLVLLGKGTGKRGKGEAKVVREIRRSFLAAYGREPTIDVVHPSGGVRRERVF